MFLFSTRNDFINSIVGFLFAAGWWIFMDGVLYHEHYHSNYTFYGFEWVPGFCSFVASIVACTFSLDDVAHIKDDNGRNDDDDDDDDYAFARHRRKRRCSIKSFTLKRFVFIVCLIIISLSVGGAFWIWFEVFSGGAWIGIAIFLQQMMNIFAFLIFMFKKQFSGLFG